MTNLLLLLALPEKVRVQYYDRLREKFPEVSITLVDHHSKTDRHIASADILMTFGPMLGDSADEVIARATNLKWIQAVGTGVDNIADLPSLGKEVVVTNIRGIQGAPVSEAALMAMLALCRDLPRVVRNQDRHEWQRWPTSLLDGKTVGIFGVGTIAEELAPKCKAMGMTVVGITSAKREVAGFDRMVDRQELVGAVAQLDHLVLLTPYSPQTKGIVDAEVFGAMKSSAFLINLGRGGVVDEAALLHALQTGQIAGAALDVFATEPLPAEHPFWAMENVLITPHLGGFCDVYAERALPVIEENLRQFLAGNLKGLTNIVER